MTDLAALTRTSAISSSNCSNSSSSDVAPDPVASGIPVVRTPASSIDARAFRSLSGSGAAHPGDRVC